MTDFLNILALLQSRENTDTFYHLTESISRILIQEHSSHIDSSTTCTSESQFLTEVVSSPIVTIAVQNGEINSNSNTMLTDQWFLAFIVITVLTALLALIFIATIAILVIKLNKKISHKQNSLSLRAPRLDSIYVEHHVATTQRPHENTIFLNNSLNSLQMDEINDRTNTSSMCFNDVYMCQEIIQSSHGICNTTPIVSIYATPGKRNKQQIHDDLNLSHCLPNPAYNMGSSQLRNEELKII